MSKSIKIILIVLVILLILGFLYLNIHVYSSDTIIEIRWGRLSKPDVPFMYNFDESGSTDYCDDWQKRGYSSENDCFFASVDQPLELKVILSIRR